MRLYSSTTTITFMTLSFTTIPHPNTSTLFDDMGSPRTVYVYLTHTSPPIVITLCEYLFIII
jgi:hypothetical protein